MPKKQSLDIFQTLRKDAFGALEEASDFEAVGKVEAEYLGRAGRLTNILKSLKNLAEQEWKEMGSTANALKKEIEEKVRVKKSELAKTSRHPESGRIDISIPGKKILRGHHHPLSSLMREVTGIFESMGFEVAEGPEVETEYYNFDALNVPKNHPARDMWNTFWLQGGGKNKNLLRTHTSPMEIRYMEGHQPPLRVIVPGRCFRYEATDATHDFQFYQLEGLMIGEKINLAHLKGIVEIFFQKLFRGKNIEVRFRPSYFPFVEPGVEGDVRLAQKGEWLEIAGAGMTHPQVIKNAGLNPNEWQGFAFGIGLDRVAMIKYKIDDIRLFYSGDLRFIKQF